MAITCEVNIAFSCVFAHVCQNVGSINPLLSIMALLFVFAIWQICAYIYTHNLMLVCLHTYVSTYIQLIDILPTNMLNFKIFLEFRFQ